MTAVTEIRSGKLGTRRAAVLYGIPRSTLRNKIFKMETEEQQQPAVVITTEHECSEDSQHSDGAIGHTHRTTVTGTVTTDPLHLSPYSMLFPPLVGGILSCQHDFGPQTEDDWEKKLEQIRRKHNLNGAAINLSEKPLPLTTNNGKSSFTCPEFKLPLLHDLVRKMTEQRLLIEQSASQIRSPVALESLRHQQEGNNHHSNGSSNNNNSQPTESTPSYTLMSLKIPSYRPAKAQNHLDTITTTTPITAPSSNDTTEDRPYDSMKIGEALKDIIVKTISEKVYKRKHQADSYSSTQDENHPGNNNNNNNCKPYSSSDLMATGPTVAPAKKLKKSAVVEKRLENNNNSNNNNNVDNGNKPVKKTRPKRGQYRKYNSQLLMEAVRAVQRGEMSVHRAGSYYGVPHSTLEYKVKERHLLRQKKIKESQMQKDSNNSSNMSSEESGNTKTASLPSGTATSARGSGSNNSNSSSNNNNNNNNNSSSKSNVASASNSSTNSGNAKSEKPSSTGSSGNGNTKNAGTKFECKSLNSPWLQPYTNGSPQYDASGMNLFTSSFALSTPASELLRKLQHKVQSKSNTFAQDSNFLSGALNRPNGMSPLGNSFLFIN